VEGSSSITSVSVHAPAREWNECMAESPIESEVSDPVRSDPTVAPPRSSAHTIATWHLSRPQEVGHMSSSFQQVQLCPPRPFVSSSGDLGEE